MKPIENTLRKAVIDSHRANIAFLHKQRIGLRFVRDPRAQAQNDALLDQITWENECIDRLEQRL